MRHPWLCRAVLVALISAVMPVCLSAQARTPGSINVTVTDAATRQPVEAARVFLAGTTFGGQTGPDGKLTLRQVAAGSYTVRVLRVGYAENSAPVTVSSGAAATTHTLAAAMSAGMLS